MQINNTLHKSVNLNYNHVKNIKFLQNKKIELNSFDFLKMIDDNTIKISFLDPQYRTILDKMKYGNEGKIKEKKRCALPQMELRDIINLIKEMNRVLINNGYLFLWVDKFILCNGIKTWLKTTDFKIVDLVIWNKMKMGMGYRTRNQAEFLLIIQKKPFKAKITWKIHNIRNVWNEKIIERKHIHEKPYNLQKELILATTEPKDLVLDVCAGSFVILDICKEINRNFLGCDILINNDSK